MSIRNVCTDLLQINSWEKHQAQIQKAHSAKQIKQMVLSSVCLSLEDLSKGVWKEEEEDELPGKLSFKFVKPKLIPSKLTTNE